MAENKQANFDALCQNIAENDPNTKIVDLDCYTLPLITDERAMRVLQALSTNTVVNGISIRVNALSVTGLEGITNFIASRSNLLKVELHNDSYGDWEIRDPDSGPMGSLMVGQLLCAASMSGTVESLTIIGTYPQISLVACLTALRPTIKSLLLSSSDFPDFTRLPKLPRLEDLTFVSSAASWQSVTTFLESQSEDGARLLKKLSLYLALKTYGSQHEIRTDSAHLRLVQAVCQTIESNTQLEEFRFATSSRSGTLPNEKNHLNMVSNTLGRHASIRNVNFPCIRDVTEVDEARHTVLLRNNRRLEGFSSNCLSLCGVCDILETLTGQPSHSLTSLDLYIKNVFDDRFAELHQRLARVLPLIKGLKHLELLCDFVEERPRLRQLHRFPLPNELIEGFRNNESMTHIEIDWMQNEIDDSSDEELDDSDDESGEDEEAENEAEEDMEEEVEGEEEAGEEVEAMEVVQVDTEEDNPDEVYRKQASATQEMIEFICVRNKIRPVVKNLPKVEFVSRLVEMLSKAKVEGRPTGLTDELELSVIYETIQGRVEEYAGVEL